MAKRNTPAQDDVVARELLNDLSGLLQESFKQLEAVSEKLRHAQKLLNKTAKRRETRSAIRKASRGLRVEAKPKPSQE